MTHACIKPGKAGHADALFDGIQKDLPDGTVQHVPHVLVILIEIRQLQYIGFGDKLAKRHHRDTRKVNAAVFHLLHHTGLAAQRTIAVYPYLHSAVGALADTVSKSISGFGGGVALGLVLGITQNQLGQRFSLLGLRVQHKPHGKRGCQQNSSQ